MIDEIQELIHSYTRWLHDKTQLKQVHADWVEITTPHLDRHNDCLQIYAKKEGNNYLLTDDGYILNDLASSGCSMDSPKRIELLKMTLAGFGIQQEGPNILVKASAENFAIKKHNLIQAMLAINDMFVLSAPHVESLFYEDVTSWLDLSDIRYTSKVKFSGQSGYDHMFDFVIPKSKQQPERILQAINNPKKDSVEALVFKWMDTRDTRSSDTKLYALLNDSIASISQSVVDAIKNYALEPVFWSERETVRETLAA